MKVWAGGINCEEDGVYVLVHKALEDRGSDLSDTDADVFVCSGEYCGAIARNAKVGDGLRGAENRTGTIKVVVFRDTDHFYIYRRR